MFSKNIPKNIIKCNFLKKYDINLEEVLGFGSYGIVYGATIKKNSEDCAIKIQFEGSVEAGVQEINILNSLGNHPHIINLLGYYPEADDQENYDFNIIVMEKANQNLSRFLEQKKGKLDKPILIQMAFDLAKGLEYAHSKNISHSDIKPGNVLVFQGKSRKKEKNAQKMWVSNPEFLFKLCDWGIGILREKNIEATMTLGDQGYTEGFCAPEIMAGKNKVKFIKADIYSLAMAILHCCGVNTFQLKSMISSLDENDHERNFKKIMKLNKVDENYGEKLVALLEKMSKFEPNERFTIEEIFGNLKEIAKEIKMPKKDSERSEKEEEIEELCDKCNIVKKEEGNISLPCKHQICGECLQNYLSRHFKDDRFFQPKCPIKTCGKILPSKKVQKLI